MYTRKSFLVLFSLLVALAITYIPKIELFKKNSINLLSTTTPQPSYKVGINYHATTKDFQSSAFIKQYHKPEIRQQVIDQITSMARSGLTILHTRIWMIDAPTSNFANNNERLHFPLSSQELANLSKYIEDVSKIKTNSGEYLKLYVSPFGAGCSSFDLSYANICPAKTFEEIIATHKTAYTDFFNTISKIKRDDGSMAVQQTYFLGEFMPGTQTNLNEGVKILWPYFHGLALKSQITPSIYFIALYKDSDVFDEKYIDINYPVLNGKKSMYWVYRGYEFLKSNNLPLPQTLDFSLYPESSNASITKTVQRVLKDAMTLFPNLNINIAETSYLMDGSKRLELGQAFAQSFFNSTQPREILFWTTPNSDGANSIGFPYDLQAFLPPIIIESSNIDTTSQKWILNIRGKGIKDGLKLNLVYNGKFWLPGELNLQYDHTKKIASAILPTNNGPDNCNTLTKCTISAQLIDLDSKTTSNIVKIELPQIAISVSPISSPIANQNIKINSATVNTQNNIWFVSISGTGLRSGLKANLVFNGKFWPSQSLDMIYKPEQNIGIINLPSKNGPENCNQASSCTLSLQLIDTAIKQTSNIVTFSLPRQ